MFLFLKNAGSRTKSLGLRSRKWKTVSCLRYRQSDISNPKQNNERIKPLMVVPAIAAMRFLF